MVLAQFVLAILEQLDERAIDVPDAEEAQVVGVNRKPSCGEVNSRRLKARQIKLACGTPEGVP